MYGVIYKAINKINGKFYIGQAVDLKRRIAKHKKVFKKLKSKFYSAIISYGWDNFIWEIIDTANTKNSLNKKEKYWIKQLKCLHPGGYNLRPGGHGGGIKGEDNSKYKKLDEEKIIDLYINKKLPTTKIAEIFNVYPPTIVKRLKKNNIQLRKQPTKIILDIPKIIDLYINHNMTAQQIAKIFGVVQTTILSRLKENNIPIVISKR